MVYFHRTILFSIASEGAAFYVRLCSKLFRGPEFVKMHLDAKHREEAKRIIEDKYFDCASVGETKTPPANATNEIPGELCGWKWFGVVRMDELMAFWHEFWWWCLWRIEGVLCSFEVPIFFWRLSDKGTLVGRCVLLAQLAQLITTTWLWFGEWYSTLSIYTILLCHFKSFKPMHCTRYCSRFA